MIRIYYRGRKIRNTTSSRGAAVPICHAKHNSMTAVYFHRNERIVSMRKAFVIALLTIAFPVFAQSNLNIDWEWKGSHQCSPSSPALVVSGIPNGTKSLQITMVDHDARHYDHGGGTIEHSGGSSMIIPEGALKNYKGPCPPNFSSFGHEYEFTVKAIAADGQSELARGRTTKTFSASTVK